MVDDPEQSANSNKLRFLAIDQWVGEPQLVELWNESVRHFSTVGQLQQLILQRPLTDGPLLVEATASRGKIPLKPMPEVRGQIGISAMWLLGEHGTDLRERFLVMPWQQPVEELAIKHGRFDQSTIERLHFEKFRIDELLEYGSIPFEGSVTQGDKPDLTISGMDQTRVGIDCCQFVDQEAKTVYQLFETLKHELSSFGRHAFEALHGSTLMLCFGIQPGVGKPPKHSQVKNVAKELAEDIAVYNPQFSSPLDENGQFLEHWPTQDFRIHKSGITYYALPWYPTTHSTFATNMGFNLSIAYSMERLVSDGWGKIRQLMRTHDQEEYDHLLISISAPDQDGLTFAGENAWFQEMLRFREPIEKPAHLSSVIFHNWSNGQVHDLKWPDNAPVLLQERHGPVRFG